MARRGRKRNTTAERYPSGGVVHNREDQSLLTRLGRMNSLRDVLNEIGRPEWGTQLGILYAKGLLLEAQKRAGESWAELVATHRRVVMDGPSGSARVSKLERPEKGRPIEYDDNLVERVAKQYDNAFCVVVEAPDGIKAMKAVNELCVEDEHLTHDKLLSAKQGLSRLAAYFGYL